MIRRISGCVPRSAAGIALWGVLAALGLVGCVGPQQTRLQSGDESEAERYGLKTVGDVCDVGNADPVPLGYVGLVTGLDGTGGEPAADNYRSMLVEQLGKEQVKNVKQMLADSDNALVVVTAMLPPGANKGDPVDVEVALPPHAGKATSLRGGVLRSCVVCDYNYTKTVNPNYAGSNLPLKGTPAVKCGGPVLVGLGDGDDGDRVKHGRIWNGGRCLRDNPLLLLLKPESQQARIACLAGERITEAFRGGPTDAPDQAVAVAHDNLAIELHVPPAYKLNLPHFLRVVRLVPLQGSPDQREGKDGAGRSYRERLAEDLLDPARTVTAALRLEALGQGSIPALKEGLKSTHPLVRFCAAESLAYMDCPAGGEELGRAVAKQPLLRAFALTALASLDESVSQTQLRDLLLASDDDETRYGAFRALRSLNEDDPLVQGEFLNHSFWLHRVPTDAPPLVHISTTRRAEIVLFGEEPTLKPPFSFLAGEFAVTATPDDENCTVSRFPHSGGVQRKQCSLKLDDLLRTMAAMGAMYPEAIELLQQAHRCDCLSCRVRSDALPQAISVFELAAAGKNGDMLNADGEIVSAPQDLGVTPTLYSTDAKPK
jgi:hypothetical protein